MPDSGCRAATVDDASFGFVMDLEAPGPNRGKGSTRFCGRTTKAVWRGSSVAKSHKGKESNWIQIVPGKGWNLLWRIYGPEQAWYDKKWRPSEIELVE